MTRKGKLNKSGSKCKSIEDLDLQIITPDHTKKSISNLEKRQTNNIRQKQSQGLIITSSYSEIGDENDNVEVLGQSLVEDCSQMQSCTTNNNLDQYLQNINLAENSKESRGVNQTKRLSDFYIKDCVINSRAYLQYLYSIQNANLKFNHLNNKNDAYGSTMVVESTKDKEFWAPQSDNSYRYPDQVLSQYQETRIPGPEIKLNHEMNPTVRPDHVDEGHLNKQRRNPSPVNKPNQGLHKKRGTINQKGYINQQVVDVTDRKLNAEDGNGKSNNVDPVIRETRLTPKELSDGSRYENVIFKSPSGKQYITLRNRAASNALSQYHLNYINPVIKWSENVVFESEK